MRSLGSRQRTIAVVAAVIAVLVAVVLLPQSWQTEPAGTARPGTPAVGSATGSTGEASTPSASGSSRRPSPSSLSGLPVCTDLPDEVDDAVAAVRNNGPYLRPRVDGNTFGNRERLLPRQPQGHYREYTVEAPREAFPGPRRLVTGGQARLGAEPLTWFYTADHYESFCELRR